MNDPPQKRRGPLLWLADCFRQRPFLTVVSSLLLLMIAAVSLISTMTIVRRRLAEEQLQRALMMQLDAAQLELVKQWPELMKQSPEEGQLSSEEPADPQPDEPAEH